MGGGNRVLPAGLASATDPRDGLAAERKWRGKNWL